MLAAADSTVGDGLVHTETEPLEKLGAVSF
jgi:hypothetical protein